MSETLRSYVSTSVDKFRRFLAQILSGYVCAWALPTFALSLGFAESPRKQASPPPMLLSETLSAWESRSRTVKSIKLGWHVENASTPELNNYQVEFPPATPPQKSPGEEEFELSGNNIRYAAKRRYVELSGEFADFDKEYLFARYIQFMRRGQDDIRAWDRLPLHLTLVRNDREHRELYTSTKTGVPPLGSIRDSSAALSSASPADIPACLLFWPVLMAFRPLEALEIVLPHHSLTLQPDFSMIGPRECLVLLGRYRSGAEYRLWVDPGEGYSVVRAIVSLNGRDLRQFDIEHANQPGIGWIPRDWNIMVFNTSDEYPGQAEVFQTARIQVDRSEINTTIPSDRFDLGFPAGTLVGNRITGEEFVALVGQATRPLSPEESRILRGRMEPKPTGSSNFPAQTFLILVGLASAVGLLISLRRRGRPRASVVLNTRDSEL